MDGFFHSQPGAAGGPTSTNSSTRRVGLALRTAEKISSVLDRFEKEISPQRLWDVAEKRLSAFVSRVRKGDTKTGSGKLSESTIAGHLAHLKAALKWAKLQKLIAHLPAFPKVKRAKMSKGGKVIRGGPITMEEFERMLEALPKVVGPAEGLRRALGFEAHAGTADGTDAPREHRNDTLLLRGAKCGTDGCDPLARAREGGRPATAPNRPTNPALRGVFEACA